MIIIERYWKKPNPRGGCKLLNKVERKAFDDDDLIGVNKFINNSSEMISGYEWRNIEYKYVKL